MGLQLLWVLRHVSNEAGPLLRCSLGVVSLNKLHVNSTNKVNYGTLFIKNNKRWPLSLNNLAATFGRTGWPVIEVGSSECP